MKKNFIILILCLVVVFSSCQEEQETHFNLITPSGTPALAISEYINNHPEDSLIVSGSTELVTAFVNHSYDIIMAPINLGVKMFNNSGDYVLHNVVVWGNLYIATKEEVRDFASLNPDKLVVFGKNSTPDLIIKTLLDYYHLNWEIEYVSDVATANALLISGEAKYIVAAEPSLEKLKQVLSINVIDLQEEWNKMTGHGSYPQAGIFVKKDLLDNEKFKKALDEIDDCINNIEVNPSKCAQSAVLVDNSFSAMGLDLLLNAIPYCNLQFNPDYKDAIKIYLEKLISLGYQDQIGGQIVGEDFYR